MKMENIPKKTFQTHEDHYELLVIPFRHCNAPLTFCIFTDMIFQPFLHNFLFVFFIDILIYKQMWESHVKSVNKALQLLWNHPLFLNYSKFILKVLQVE